MENFRGLCTRCGIAHSDPNHACTDADIRLLEIDKEAGSRAVREALIALGQKGFNNKIEVLEAEAATLRAAKIVEEPKVEAEIVEEPKVEENIEKEI